MMLVLITTLTHPMNIYASTSSSLSSFCRQINIYIKCFTYENVVIAIFDNVVASEIQILIHFDYAVICGLPKVKT